MSSRVRTVFAAFVFFGVATQAAVTCVGLMCAWWQTGRQPWLALLNTAVMFEQTPFGFVICRLPAHVVLVVGTLLLSGCTPRQRRTELGLARCPWSGAQMLTAAFASLLPLVVSLALMAWFVPILWPDPFYDQFSWPAAAVFLTYMTCIPAFTEELFFRGYMQRRLLRHWSPPAAIFTTAMLFTVAHGITPIIVVQVFPVGLWLGVLAWRTGSLWPGCACHACLNAVSCGWPIISRLSGLSPEPSIPVATYLAVVVSICFIHTGNWLCEAVESDARISRDHLALRRERDTLTKPLRLAGCSSRDLPHDSAAA